MRLILTGVLVLSLFSCTTKEKSHTRAQKGFYYWQTSLGSFEWSDSLYKSMEVDKIYLRYFDVDWDEANATPIPVSPVKRGYYYGHQPDSVNIIPVVFITNETFKNITVEGAKTLAHQVYHKLKSHLLRTQYDYGYSKVYSEEWWQQNPNNKKTTKFNELEKHDSIYNATLKQITEVQFDCDWTKSTKDKYFAFLTESKRLFKDKTISSTIRLYQYKYPKEAGLPPVDRGMLMCYNAGSIKDNNTENSIFDKREIMSYLDNGSKYPIDLDYALPIFEWAVLFHEGKFKNILSTGSLREEMRDSLILTQDNRYTVNTDFVYGNTAASILIRKGDEIRFERPDMDGVNQIASWLSDHKNNSNATISFYHLNQYDLQTHSKEIKAIFSSF